MCFMRVQKRENYIKNIYAALHTLAINCAECNSDNADGNVVKSVSRKKVRNKDEYKYYLQLNPNKVVPGDMIRGYSQFMEVVQQVVDLMEISDFTIGRADMSFNSDAMEDYDLYSKLNRLIICCISKYKNIPNCYESRDLWSLRSLSIAIKNEYLEAENYNKSIEDPNVLAKNRLELRSKRMKLGLVDEFQYKWVIILDAAVQEFDSVQERYNEELAKIWNMDIQKPKKERDFVSWTAFVLQFKDCIFTRKQLRELLELIGVQNPDGAAKRFKDRHQIEFFSKNDLVTVVQALKDAMNVYFSA